MQKRKMWLNKRLQRRRVVDVRTKLATGARSAQRRGHDTARGGAVGAAPQRIGRRVRGTVVFLADQGAQFLSFTRERESGHFRVFVMTNMDRYSTNVVKC